MRCQFAFDSDYDCNCPTKQLFRECTNAARLSQINERTDGAAFHTLHDKGLVRADYCGERDCVDFVPADPCRYAVATSQRWAGAAAECFVVECRNPDALGKLTSFHNEKGAALGGVRRPCGEDFKLIPNAAYLHVRSRFCNKYYCPFFEPRSRSGS